MTTLLGLSPTLIATRRCGRCSRIARRCRRRSISRRVWRGRRRNAGLFPQAAAEIIAGCCSAELYDLDVVAKGSARAGTLAIPVVKLLGEEVRRRDRAAAAHVHLGATSQDVLDTGLVLQLRAAVALLVEDAIALARAFAGAHAANRHQCDAGADVAAAGDADHLRAEGGPDGWDRSRVASHDLQAAAAGRPCCCNMAGRPARSRCSAPEAWRCPRRWGRSWDWRCPPHPGRGIATGWPNSLPPPCC